MNLWRTCGGIVENGRSDWIRTNDPYPPRIGGNCQVIDIACRTGLKRSRSFLIDSPSPVAHLWQVM